MPRPWRETVRDWPAFSARVWYLVQVVSLAKVAAPPAIRATLAFREPPQDGRTYVVLLPLPVRLAGQVTADFLIAAGLEVASGATVAPLDAVGAHLRVRFAQDAEGGWHVDRVAAPEKP